MIRQPVSSRRLVLALERATPSVRAISSAGSGSGERSSRAWICATVRLTPHWVPISPQWRTKRCSTGLRSISSEISVRTEIIRIRRAREGSAQPGQQVLRGALGDPDRVLTGHDDHQLCEAQLDMPQEVLDRAGEIGAVPAVLRGVADLTGVAADRLAVLLQHAD